MTNIPSLHLITAAEAAKLIHCTTNTVYNYLRSGKIRGIKINGGPWLIDSRSCRNVPRSIVGRPRGVQDPS